MKKIIYLFCFLFLFSAAQAQEFYVLKGYVTDSLEKTPLVGATVSLNYGQMNALTNEKGFYQFTVPKGELILSLKYVGYMPFRTALMMTKNTIVDISIGKVENQLEEVIVSSKSLGGNVKRPLLGVSTVSIKTLQKLPTAMGEVDILKGLQMLPGVTSVGEAANGVNIRGGTTDQNLLLIDGAPIFNPTHMFGLFSAFPSDAVSTFDLYKGNVPSRFGGRTAAVLDVTLAQPSLDKFKMQGGVSFVSNRLKMDIPLVKDKMGIMLSGRASYNDFIFPIISDKLDDIRANFIDGAAKYFWRMNERNTLTISSYYSKDFFQTEILGSLGDINATSTQYDYRTLNLSAQWLRVINSKLNWQTTVVSSKYVPILLLPELSSDNKVSISSGVDYRQAKTNLNYWSGKHKIEGGIDATAYAIHPGELNPGTSISVGPIKIPDEQSIETGIYIEDEIEFSSRLTVSGGVRYSQYFNVGPSNVRIYAADIRDELSLLDTVAYAKGSIVKSYGGFEPRIGLRYTLSPLTSIKAGYNLMRQYLQVVSNTTTPIPTARWKASDTYIKPQVSSLYTVGIFHNLPSAIYEVSGEVYYRLTNNIIDYRPGADFLLQQFPEGELLQGQNKSYGLELMVSKKKGELTGWLNYTYSRSLNKVNEGDAITQQINLGNWYAANYDRPHSFNSTIVVNQGKHHDFSFNFTYSTGRPYSTPQGFIQYQGRVYPYYEIRNNSRLPDYHRLDFAWNIYQPSMKEKRWKGNWTFTVYNLYGRKNAYSIFLRTQGQAIKAYKLSIFNAPLLSLSYNFKFS